jgi:GNAT superfamily N-acetyltransferase
MNEPTTTEPAEPAPAAVHIEELAPADDPIVHAFIKKFPRGEYTFLKDDLGDPAVLDTWRGRGTTVFVAYLEGDPDLAGLVAVIPGLGWSRHVGDMRMVVDPAKRGRGVGATLARRALTAAVATGLKKVTVEVLADQPAVSALFADLAFTPEALLADHVQDDQGHYHDLLILAHPVEETMSALSSIGMLDAGVRT